MTATEPATQQPQPQPPKRHRFRSKGWIITGSIAGGVLILAGVGLAAGGGTTPTTATSPPAAATPAAPPPPAPSPPPSTGPEVALVGDTMTMTQNGQDAAEITITSVDVTTQPSDQYGSAPQNGYFVTAHVRIKVLGSYTGGVDIYSGDFYAKTGSEHYDEGNGNAYDAAGSNNEISAMSLGAGETAGGTLVFDMPRPHGQIAYAPNLDGQAIGYWKF